jgi:hypothetical protein
MRVPLPAAITITFSAMRNLLSRGLIIGIALLLLGGCATLRLGYSNGPTLAWWWLDRHAGFSREQAPLVREGINDWFDWHRSTQLEGYATLLAEARRDILQPTTPAAVCAWQDRFQALVEPAVEQAVQVAAPLLPRLEAANLDRIAQRQARRMEELRREHLQTDAAERRRASVQRTAERYQRVYGRLSAEQRDLLAAELAEAPLDPERWLAERERRQQAVLEGLRAASAPSVDAEARKTALRALAAPAGNEDPAAQARRQRVAAFQCELTARLHNSTTSAQRERAQRTLQGWEDDLRSLAGPGA